VRHWTSKSDYTQVEYRGIVPLSVAMVAEDGENAAGVRIITKPLGADVLQPFPNSREAGAMVSVASLLKEIEDTSKQGRREFLPVGNVNTMISRATHYALKDRFDSKVADPKKWPDPPHIRFANAAFNEPKDVKRFVQTYGFSPVMFQTQSSAISVHRFKWDQTWLREAWSKPEYAQVDKEHFIWNPDDVRFHDGKPRIFLSDIWDYILVLFFIDFSADRLRVCPNSGCQGLKYFTYERPNQKFCSVTCKNSVHMNLWLADPKNREMFNTRRRRSFNEKPKAELTQTGSKASAKKARGD
jgi:hypothetical protein